MGFSRVGQLGVGILFGRTEHAVVVIGGKHGRDHLLNGHAQSRYGSRTRTGGEWQLGLVGIPFNGHADGFCLRSAVAPFRSDDRY